MSEIDVSDVLLDSDVAGDAFVVIRRPETVDNTGFESTQEVRLQAYGAIQPAGIEFLREVGYDIDTKAIEVLTPFRLRSTSKDRQGTEFKPDVIPWEGNNFIVKHVEDWSRYGAGFVKALAVSEDFVDNAE